MEKETSLSSDEVVSKFSKQHPPPFEDEKRRKEFVSNVQLRCENILNQVRLLKGTSDVNAVSKDSVESSGSNLTKESSSESKGDQRQTSELSQSIKQRIESRKLEILRDLNIAISTVSCIDRLSKGFEGRIDTWRYKRDLASHLQQTEINLSFTVYSE